MNRERRRPSAGWARGSGGGARSSLQGSSKTEDSPSARPAQIRAAVLPGDTLMIIGPDDRVPCRFFRGEWCRSCLIGTAAYLSLLAARALIPAVAATAAPSPSMCAPGAT